MILFDIRFPSTKSSLAISIIDDIQDNNFGRAVEHVNNIQKTKSNHFAIVICPEKQHALWIRYQYAILPGDTRLLRANNIIDVADIIQSVVTLFSDTAKLDAQQQFIQYEKSNLHFPETCRNIFTSVVEKLGLNMDEQRLLMESVGSIGNLMTVSKESLEMNCPIDIEHINRITDFFSAASKVDSEDDM